MNINRDELMDELFGSDSEDIVTILEAGDHNTSHNVEDEDEYNNVEDEINGNADPCNDPNGDHGPRTGMVYGSIECLYTAYQDHAKRMGFSVCKRTLKKGSERDYKYATMVCYRGRKVNTQNYSKRIDCPARLNAIRKEDGSWMVSKMQASHNHPLDPNTSILMPAHRTMSVHMKRQLEANDIAGIRPCKNVRLCEVQANGPMNLGCLPKDCRNFIDSRRRLRLGVGDAEAIRGLFLRLQQKDSRFFHLMDIDDDGRLRNVLWIHPRSRAAYEEFHDAVSFDTTYLVNRYKMPFAVVVGVNHHGQSILLGCALVTHEDAESFKWLFSNWLDAMGGVHPNAIITDQCESIKVALKEVMPNTIHRFCLWHILSKLPVKFKGVADFNKAIVEFKGIVYDSLTIETFEIMWDEFLIKYRMQTNQWLKDLFNERESWVPVYLKHIFWAGMVSTQRSEGMHAYFDEFVHSKSTLKQFMEQYEVAIGNKIQKEFMADYDSNTKVLRLVSQFHWERQLRKVYTNAIFKQVQAEILRMLYCHIVPASQASAPVGIEKFNVLERSIVNDFFVKEFTYTVEYRPSGDYLNCNCKNFEFKGILCCHIFKVMAQNDIQSLNNRYLLHRWRKDVYRRHSSIFFAGGYPHMTEEYKKFQEVERHFQECTDLAVGSQEKMDFVNQRCIETKNQLLNWNPTMQGNVRSSGRTTETAPVTGGEPVLNPRVTPTRGRPRINRYLSTRETIIRRGARGRGPRGRASSTSRGTGGRASSSSRGRATSVQSAGRGRVSSFENNYEAISSTINYYQVIGTQGSSVI